VPDSTNTICFNGLRSLCGEPTKSNRSPKTIPTHGHSRDLVRPFSLRRAIKTTTCYTKAAGRIKK